MTVDELFEKSNIKFPKRINMTDAENMLHYLSDKLKVNINYNKSFNIALYAKDVTSEDETISAKNVSKQYGSVALKGTINSLDSSVISEGFEFTASAKNPVMFDSLKFSLVPGWVMWDYSPSLVSFWDETKVLVGEYLTQKNSLGK